MNQSTIENKIETATFGAGCFWCVEAIFERLEGVIQVESGYAGGTTKDPTYEEVCTGKTGHVEVIQVSFDSESISYKQLLDIFWKSHDPTTLNRQGADIGTQYRSAIFYNNKIQKKHSEKSRTSVDSSGMYTNPIVTEINALKKFYPAEDYHQDYYRLNRQTQYCQLVIKPKLDKMNN
jgi:peptide-methionine (S)-S-oxide reductase